jgi:hypothetical protein
VLTNRTDLHTSNQFGEHMEEHPQEENLPLRAYLQIVGRRLWLILAIVIIGVMHTFISSVRKSPSIERRPSF